MAEFAGEPWPLTRHNGPVGAWQDDHSAAATAAAAAIDFAIHRSTIVGGRSHWGRELANLPKCCTLQQLSRQLGAFADGSAGKCSGVIGHGETPRKPDKGPEPETITAP